MSQTKAQLIEGLNINTSAPADALVIDSSGRVAVGTTSIGTGALTVYGASTARAMFQGTSTGTGDSQGFTTGNNGGVNAFLWNYENGFMQFATNNTERIRIDSSGNVGVGLTSPTEFVDIRKDQNAFTWAQIQNQNTSSGAYAGIQFGANGNTWGLANGSSAANSNSLVFVLDAGGTNSEKMRIDTQGRLLAGTTSTSVAARAIFQASSGGSGGGILILSRGTSTPSNNQALGELYFSDSGHVASASVDAKRNGGTWTSGSSQPTALTFATTADGSSSKTERMRIDSAGRLIVGSTDASGSSLRVDAASGTDGPLFDSGGTGNSNHALLVRDSANNQLLRVNNDGKVGVGTANPDSNSLLSVNGVINLPDDVAIAWGGGTNRSSWSGNKASGFLRAYTNGGERMRIDSSGRVAIGLSSNITSLFHVESSYAGTIAEIKNTRGSASTDGGLLVETSTTAAKTLSVKNSGTERFYVQGNGVVYVNDSLGIGTASPGEELVVRANAPSVQLESSNASGRSYGMQSDSNGKFHVVYDATAGANRITVNNLGEVGINQTTPVRALEVRDASNTVNSIIRIGTQATSSTTNGFAQLEFKHGSANGAFIWHNAGSTTSYAGANSMNFYNGHAADFGFFTNGNNERVRIRNGGGISFNGDTADANALDDYEEGTFTPSIVAGADDGSGGTAPLSIAAGRYTKIGNKVYVDIFIRFASGASSNGTHARIGSLPFSISNLSYGGASYTRGGGTSSFHNTTNDITSNYGQNNTTYFFLYFNGGQNFVFGGSDNTSLSGEYWIGTFHYHTDS